MKAVVAAFIQEKVIVGAFSVITNLQMDLRFKLYCDIVTNPLLSSMIVIVCTNEQPPCCSPLPAPVLGLSSADIIPLKSELS